MKQKYRALLTTSKVALGTTKQFTKCQLGLIKCIYKILRQVCVWALIPGGPIGPVSFLNYSTPSAWIIKINQTWLI